MRVEAAIQIKLQLGLRIRRIGIRRGRMHMIVMTKVLCGLASLMFTIGASHRPGHLEWQKRDHEEENDTAQHGNYCTGNSLVI